MRRQKKLSRCLFLTSDNYLLYALRFKPTSRPPPASSTMPPKGSTYRASANDTSYEDTTIARQKLAAQAVLAGRGRRNGATALANGGAAKDVVALSNCRGQNLNDGVSSHHHASPTLILTHLQPILEWSKMDREILHAYRTAYRLPCSASFKNPHATSILASPIGKSSPTMARTKEKRRITKEQLALQVRKTFNDMAVNENETVLDVMYKLRNKSAPFSRTWPRKRLT